MLREHYISRDIDLPYRFTMREFAFVYMGGKGMHRPVAFSSKKEAFRFLKRKTPLHSYYSTAYYSNPRAPMKDKEWMGADLVFDLDADHIPEGKDLSYTDQLKLVKKKTKLLINDFLLDDFGFVEDDITLNFSGNRGYHIHVRRKDILGMSSQSRREIVDYITGVGLNIDVILPKKTLEVDKFRDIKKSAVSPKLPPKEEGGWRKRTRKLTIKLLERWSKMQKDEVIEEMEQKHGIGKKTAEGLHEHLFKKGKWKKIVEEGILDVFPERGKINVSSLEEIIKGIIMEENIQEIGSEIVGNTDEPVTGDTKRLIRLPNSIHGGSFLEVKKINLDDIDYFEPLKDAVPKSFGDKKIELKLDDIPLIEEIEIKDKNFAIDKKMSVPEYVAPFLITKFGAKII